MSDPLTVAILIFDDVEILDFAGPFEVFSRARMEPGVESRRSDDGAPFRVLTVAKTTDPITATGGLRVVPEASFENAPDIDILVVPGGFGTRPLLDDAETIDWIRARAAETEITASVCTGALLLAKGGLLEGGHATTHWAATELLASLGDFKVDGEARFIDEGAVITSAGVAAGIDMSLYLLERLCGKEVADDTARYIDYPRDA